MSIRPCDIRFKSYCDYLTDTSISEESIFFSITWASFNLTRTANENILSKKKKKRQYMNG